MPFFLMLGILTILCISFGTYVLKKGHPFYLLSFIIFNCALLLFDVVLFHYHEYIPFHITSYSSLMSVVCLYLFFKNLHTKSLSKRDKFLLAIPFIEYLVILLLYIIHFYFGDLYFENLPSKAIIDYIGRTPANLGDGAKLTAMAKDLILFVVQLIIFPFAFHQILLELKKAKRRHLNYFTNDTFQFYNWNQKCIVFIGFCYFLLCTIMFHDFFIEYIPVLRSVAYVLAGLFGLGLGVLVYISPVLVKEKGFSIFLDTIQTSKKLVNNDEKYDNQIQEVRDIIVTDKIYNDPNLTLTSLAESLDMSSRHLSRIINEKTNKSFSDFINTYRVEEVKQKLLDKDYSHYAILSLGLEAGFNSKTTFYTTFKKLTGLTPNQYRLNKLKE